MDGMLLPIDFHGGRLRRMKPADLKAFQAYRAIPELGLYQGWSPMSETEALNFLTEMQLAPLFKAGEWIQLGIAESDSDLLVGDIGLFLAEDGCSGEVGFTLQPSCQGRGIATLAVKEALRLFFAATETKQIVGVTDALNLASIRLLQRLGFRHAETREVVFKGLPCVEHIYVLSIDTF
jgi:RimJ/RimL family protein N-acetyltransferase